ncbi:MAG: hypothetical protein EOP11_00675 [Proteobacteria bacterium]|nr:MAG: hypothetical protein EOP11_00675 [Pseudomonadota bacterium]
MNHESLLKLARWKMPFGRYEGWLIAELPEPYLVWYSAKGFPDGELGQLLAMMLEMRANGLESLLQPLKPKDHSRPPMKPAKR